MRKKQNQDLMIPLDVGDAVDIPIIAAAPCFSFLLLELYVHRWGVFSRFDATRTV